jgi:HD-like signal output (HDOD) protein
VVIQLLEAARSETNLKKPAEIISREPSLAAEILTIVNSPWFDLKREIRTINHAVALLGVDAVCSLASAFAIRDNLKQFDRSSFDYSSYWRRSVLAATAARVLAPYANAAEPEEVFLAGLLQDIGMLVMAQTFPQIYPQLIREAEKDHRRLRAMEEQDFGTDHVQIGVWLAEVWNLPDAFRVAIATSHAPDAIEFDDGLKPLVSCVALSGPFADLWENPETSTVLPEIEEAASISLGFGLEELHTALLSTAKGFRNAAEIFKVPIEGPDRTHQILAGLLEKLPEETLPGRVEQAV